MRAKLFGPVDERVLASAAAAVELIHNASLIHDDVVDLNAMTRRSRGPTVNAVWDNHIAVLVGDSLQSSSAMQEAISTGDIRIVDALRFWPASPRK